MRRLVLLVPAVSAALILASSAAAADSPAVVTTTPLADQVIFNQCTHELLLASGTLHTTTRFVIDDSGEHVMADFTYSQFKAVAPATGAEYVLARGSRNNHYADAASFDFLPSVLVLEQNLIMVRLGEDASYPAGDDFHLFITMTLVVDPNGVTRVDRSDFRLECI